MSSHNEDMDYANEDESSDDMEANNYYKLSNLPSNYPVSYTSRKTGNKSETGIGLPLRKSIMVGSSYQASIPELSKKPPYSEKKKPYVGEDKLLWSPYKLTNCEVEKYLSTVQRIHLERAQGVAAIPRGAHTRDDEEALYLLLQDGFIVDKTLQRIRISPPLNDTAAHWSEEECKHFESGIRIYGKEFFLIRNNKVKSRTIGELVQFYYLWKKTERHDVFANRIKLEKKKYSLHPGVTVLDDHDDNGSYKDGNFTNIQCLIYGDAKKYRGSDMSHHALYNNPTNDNKKTLNHANFGNT